MYSKVIVGVDFSPVSDRAITAAVALARATGATMVLVHVIPVGAEVREAASSESELRPSIEQRLRDTAAKMAAEEGIKVDWGVVNGRPATELARYIELWGGEVVVMGSEGRTGLGRILIGSVAEELVQRSPVPVLVVGPHARV